MIYCNLTSILVVATSIVSSLFSIGSGHHVNFEDCIFKMGLQTLEVYDHAELNLALVARYLLRVLVDQRAWALGILAPPTSSSVLPGRSLLITSRFEIAVVNSVDQLTRRFAL